MSSPPPSLWVPLFQRKMVQDQAGELEGAEARLELPRLPCTAREAASKARTFPPGRGGKATGYKAVEKVHQGRNFFRSLSGREDACPLRRLFVQEKIFFQAGLDRRADLCII